MLCSDHHHFYFLICVHTCVFCSRTFATFRAVLEFAACHGCIEFSAKRGTKLLQKRREKIVSSLPAQFPAAREEKRDNFFVLLFNQKMRNGRCKMQKLSLSPFSVSSQTSLKRLLHFQKYPPPKFAAYYRKNYGLRFRFCICSLAELHTTGVLTTCINDPHKNPSTYFPSCKVVVKHMHTEQ